MTQNRNQYIMKKFLKTKLFIFIWLMFGFETIYAQDVTVNIDATLNKCKISPYIYGRNNTFDKPVQFYKDAGLRMARMNGGNNATKYNWRKKMSSHPDWYNNVYGNDWDKSSQDMVKNYPDMQGMWAFQLLGRVASSANSNFNDWGYNQSQWWFGVGQNLAGGGVPNTTDASHASVAKVEGNITLYTQEWPADSTVAILNHWFQPVPQGLGLDKNRILYWNMDNEPDIWNGTHDDVMKNLPSASAFMDKYIQVAKKAKAIFPGIKLCGPVTTSEWQWYKWGSESIWINGKYYCWLEYFIKRCADEEKATGVRVLDVVDLHNYPWAKNGDVDALQLHRMYYDTEYVYAGANGLFTISGGWDTKLDKEYIFKRINDWLDQYYGANSGIACGISEWSPATTESNASATAVAYASHLGTFANNGVEYFTPWTWMNGMWETLHLFSRYAKSFSVASTSSNENMVSAYTTVNQQADSMTVMIVNRDMSSSRNITVNINNFIVNDGNYSTLQLSSLPSTETFISHTNNALKTNVVAVNTNSFKISVPSLSVTAVVLKSATTGIDNETGQSGAVKLYPDPANTKLNIGLSSALTGLVRLRIYELSGKMILDTQVTPDGQSTIQIDTSGYTNGTYFLSLLNRNVRYKGKFIVNR